MATFAFCFLFTCMRREFLLNLFFLLAINLLVKPLYLFGVDLPVQKHLGDEYGLYFTLFSLSFFFQILSDWGIQAYSNSLFAPSPQLIGKYFPKIFWLKMLLLFALLPLGLALAMLLGYGGWTLFDFSALLLNQMLIMFIGFLRANIAALRAYRLDSFFSALDKILMLLFCGGLLFSGYLNLSRFILAQTAAYLCTFLPALYYLHRRLPRAWYWPRFDRVFIFWLLRKSSPYAIIILLMTTYSRIDGVLLGQLSGKAEANAYAFAYRFLDALNMLGYLLAGLLMPMFGRLLRQGAALAKLFDLALRLVLVGSISFSICSLLYAPQLIELLLGYPAPYLAQVSRVLLLCLLPMSAIYVYGPLLTVGGQIHAMNKAFGLAILINIAGNSVAIPYYGALGAASVAFATQLWIVFAEAYLVYVHYRLADYRRLLPQLFLFVLLAALSFAFLRLVLALPWQQEALFLLFALAILAFLSSLLIFPSTDLLRKLRKGEEEGGE